MKSLLLKVRKIYFLQHFVCAVILYKEELINTSKLSCVLGKPFCENPFFDSLGS